MPTSIHETAADPDVPATPAATATPHAATAPAKLDNGTPAWVAPLKLAGWFLATCLGYVAFCQFSNSIVADSISASPVWFADGWALGIYMLASRRVGGLSTRLAVMVGIFLANIIYAIPMLRDDYSINFILIGSFVNVLQAGLAAEILNLLRKRSKHWLPARRLSFFLLICVVLVNALAAALSAASAAVMIDIDFVEEFWTTIISDGLGIIIMVPLMMAWARHWQEKHLNHLRRGWPEIVVMLACLTGATWWAYARAPEINGLTPPYFYVGLPFLLWSALRLGTRSTTLALLIYSTIAVYFTSHQQGPFMDGFTTTVGGILRLQQFLLVFVAAMLVTMAILMERAALSREKFDLERRNNAALRAGNTLIFEIVQRTNEIVWVGDTVGLLGVAKSEIGRTRDWFARIHPDDRPRINGTGVKLLSGEWPAAELEYRIRRGGLTEPADKTVNGETADEKNANDKNADDKNSGDKNATDPKSGNVDKTDYVTVAVNAFAHKTRLEDGRIEHRVIGFVKDITDKKHEDAVRRRLEIELRQAQKMEAIGQLAGGIAHDFNNILASIIGYGEMARNNALNGTPMARHLDAVLKAGERGRVLVSQILTFSRKTPDKKQVVDIADLTDEIVMLLRGSTPHTIAFNRGETDGDRYLVHRREAIHVLGNATELHQLIMNLATNGLQAMPDAGALTIALDEQLLTAPKVVLQGQLRPGRYVTIAVSDQGGGIDDATKSRMFEPFFTTKPTGKGTGLGLSIAMSVAKAHGGGIDVESHVAIHVVSPASQVENQMENHLPTHAAAAGREAAGTTFTVYLPIFGASASRGLDRDAARAAQFESSFPPTTAPTVVRGNDQCLLLVDDEAPMREMAAEILASLGYQSVSFESSAEALAAFERQPDRFDAVLTDEVMPELAGTELAKRIHAIKPEVPIFIITGYGGLGFELRAQEAGIARILRKPYEAHELAEVLANAFSVG